MEIYVGNVGYTVTEQDLKALFEKFGSVSKVNYMEDKMSGQTRGWAFVSMDNEAEALKAIAALNLKDFKGKKLKVNKYRAKKDDPNKPKFGQWMPR